MAQGSYDHYKTNIEIASGVLQIYKSYMEIYVFPFWGFVPETARYNNNSQIKPLVIPVAEKVVSRIEEPITVQVPSKR